VLLKTYRGPNLTAALRQARAELGPDALVLGRTKRRGRLGLEVHEITVAAPRAVAPAEAGPDAILRGLARDVREARQAAGAAPTAPAQRRPKEPRPAARSEPVARTPAIDALEASGLSRPLAVRLAQLTEQVGTAAPDAEALARAAARGFRELIRFAELPLRPRCLFVAGPPGAGKTTTVAKLAARAMLDGAGAVFFADADVDGIGSFERTEVYCRHLGVQAARIREAEDLRCALRHAGKHGTVLVDTAGIGASDEERAAELGELRRQIPDAGLAVLVPAGLHHDEARRVLGRFAGLAPTHVGFSKIDDGERVGELVTALATETTPLSFFTSGHRVPEDLEPATPQRLAKLLVRATTGARSAGSVA
jgi:flagellar biosynthesis protein FlhF